MYPSLYTDAELAESRRILIAHCQAHIAFGRAERAEQRARSDAARDRWRAECARAHAAIVAANQAIDAANAEGAARFARWLAEQEQPACVAV